MKNFEPLNIVAGIFELKNSLIQLAKKLPRREWYWYYSINSKVSHMKHNANKKIM